MTDTQDDWPSPTLLKAGLETVPQKTFSKADQFFLQATELEEQAAELACKVKDTKAQADHFRATGYDLQRLATQDRDQIQSKLESILQGFTDVLPVFHRTKLNAERLDELTSAVEEGTATITTVLKLRDELLDLRKDVEPGISEDTISSPIKTILKRRRESSSLESSASDNFDSIDQLQANLAKKWKEDLQAHQNTIEDVVEDTSIEEEAVVMAEEDEEEIAVQVEETPRDSDEELPYIPVATPESVAKLQKRLLNITSNKKLENAVAVTDNAKKDGHSAKNRRDKRGNSIASPTQIGAGTNTKSTEKTQTAPSTELAHSHGNQQGLSKKQRQKQNKNRRVSEEEKARKDQNRKTNEELKVQADERKQKKAHANKPLQEVEERNRAAIQAKKAKKAKKH